MCDVTWISVGLVDPNFSIASAARRGVVGRDRLLLQELPQARVGLFEVPGSNKREKKKAQTK